MGLFSLFWKTTESQPVVKLAAPQKPNRRVVKPDNTPLYLRRGWSKRGNRYQGYYRTRYGAWRGEIERRGDRFMVYIFGPPQEQIKNHSRWACFHKQSGGKWRIDLAVNPKDGDISAIIFYVERVVVESFER